MPGPPPTPDYLKVVRGFPGHHKRAKSTDAAAARAALPPAPVWLPDRAKEAWRSIGQPLADAGFLGPLDCFALELLVVTYDEWRSAREEVEAEGGARSRTASKIASDAGKRLQELLRDFGATPASRARVHPLPAPKELDELEEFLARPRHAFTSNAPRKSRSKPRKPRRAPAEPPDTDGAAV